MENEELKAEKTAEVIEAIPKKDEVDVKFSKKWLMISAIVVIVLLAALAVWKFGLHNKAYAWVMPASVTVTVTDTDSSKAISQAEVKVDGKTFTTSDEGIAEITGLSAKTYTFDISALGYISASKTQKLNRKINSFAITLTFNVQKVTVQGAITNYVNETVLSDVDITTKYGTVKSDAEGNFEIKDAVLGDDATIDLVKTGYIPSSQSIKIGLESQLALTLTPVGRVYFISNRDAGKRGIYTCNFDGSDVKILVKRVDDTEDYNFALSPDRSKAVFLSTREKRNSDYGVYQPTLYLINSDGTALTKLSAEVSIYNINWSSDSKYVAWNSQPDPAVYISNLNLYSVKSKQTEKVNTNSMIGSSSFSHGGTMIAWTQSLDTSDPASVAGVFYKTIGGDAKQIGTYNSYSVDFTDNDLSVRFNYYDQAQNKSIYKSYKISDGTLTDYTPDNNQDVTKIVSPDKKSYAYASTRDGKTDLFVSDVSGKNEKKLTTMGTVTGTPEWELGSEYILFDSSKTAETAIYIVSIKSGEAKKVTDEFLDNGGMQ